MLTAMVLKKFVSQLENVHFKLNDSMSAIRVSAPIYLGYLNVSLAALYLYSFVCAMWAYNMLY